MTQEATHYLTAGGSLSHETLHCALLAADLDDAQAQARKIAAALYKGGWFNFWLVDAASGTTLATLSVTPQEPKVSVRQQGTRS